MIKSINKGALGILVALNLIIAGGLISTSHVSAAFDPTADVCSQPGAADSPTCKTDPSKNPFSGNNGVILKAAQVVALVAGIAAVIMIVISGFQFITSAGDPQKVATARQTILYAVIGLIIAALAQALVSFVLSKL